MLQEISIFWLIKGLPITIHEMNKVSAVKEAVSILA
ncbi:MAG: hypothetical protein IEMM0008_1499 [bacterium]|nr:MAG: hypothetical protein IEMM0008_1499 [bacterium]